MRSCDDIPISARKNFNKEASEAISKKGGNMGDKIKNMAFYKNEDDGTTTLYLLYDNGTIWCKNLDTGYNWFMLHNLPHDQPGFKKECVNEKTS